MQSCRLTAEQSASVAKELRPNEASENPASLEQLCLESICDNIIDVFELYCESNSRLEQSSYFDDDSEIDDIAVVKKKKFRFRDKEVFLFNEISEKLLVTMCDRGVLCDSTLSLFNESNTRLKCVRLRNCKKVTAEGLKVLKWHKITDFECINLRKVNSRDILGEFKNSEELFHFNFQFYF